MASTGEPHGLFWDDDGGDRLYNANSMEYWLKKFFTSGVFNGDLQVRATSGMTLVVGSGYANVDGKVRFWNADFNVTLSPANSTYPRIDTVVITRDNVNRDIRCEVVTGAYSADTPQPTPPVRNSETYQLVLAQIYVGIGATSVSQSDITDTRVDSELCGYITGTVEELDFSAFTAQFERYFAEFKATHMANFSAWELAQKAAYNSWFDLVKQQQIQDKASWDAWYADLQEELHELPPESAEYLQIQIDEIRESGLSGSILKISTINSELEGKTVTVTGNYHNEERTGIFDENLECEIIGIKSVGNVNISSTDGIRTAEAILNIPYYGNYNVPIAFWAATINLQGDENLYGALVTIKNSNDETVGTVVLSAVDGTATFTATAPDTYTFSVTYQGEEITQTLVADEETTYEVSLSAGFNYKTWCTLGGVDATQYSSLADVFADELAVHRLMTVHASADYLIEAVTDDISVIDDFCTNDTAMKWIGLRDYVCDGLTAINGVEAKFLASQYWERYLKDHVPTMTSNNAPYGEAFASSTHSSGLYPAWKTFANDIWISSSGAVSSQYVGYSSPNPIKISKVKLGCRSDTIQYGVKTFKVQGSNDGTTWVDVDDTVFDYNDTSADMEFNVSSNGYYLKHRIATLSNQGGTSNSQVEVARLQFYGRALDVSVPIMTSNTAPYGEAFSDYSGANAYYAFDNSTSTLSGAQVNGRMGYKFTDKICVKKVLLRNRECSNGNILTFKIQGSNDNTWNDLTEILTNEKADTANAVTMYDVPSSEPYRDIALQVLTIYTDNVGSVSNLQFYGVDYSEREFEPNSGKKWLYDHGLELEPITVYPNAEKSSDGYLAVANQNSSINANYFEVSGVNLANYSLVRAIAEDVFAGNNGYLNIGKPTQAVAYNAFGSNPNTINLNIGSVDSGSLVITGNAASRITEWWLE